jgi:hypothetical protein
MFSISPKSRETPSDALQKYRKRFDLFSFYLKIIRISMNSQMADVARIIRRVLALTPRQHIIPRDVPYTRETRDVPYTRGKGYRGTLRPYPVPSIAYAETSAVHTAFNTIFLIYVGVLSCFLLLQ